jgi:hypothetical protein
MVRMLEFGMSIDPFMTRSPPSINGLMLLEISPVLTYGNSIPSFHLINRIARNSCVCLESLR